VPAHLGSRGNLNLCHGVTTVRLTRNLRLGGPPAHDPDNAELRSGFHDELCNFLGRLLHPSRASIGHLHFGRTQAHGHANDLAWIDEYGPGGFSCLVCLGEFEEGRGGCLQLGRAFLKFESKTLRRFPIRGCKKEGRIGR
jgi:hypothetical protein